VTAAEPKRRRQARLGGFDLHANTSVRAKNRPKLERLCRYLLRPPVAEDRLSFAPDGSVLLRLKTPWRDGTSHIALQPMELLEKLAALIPRPYVNLIVYHGVLAPNAKWRGEVVVFGPARVESEPSASSPRKVAVSYNRTWPSSCAAASTSMCCSALIAAGACGLWPPSCSQAPSAESSVIWASLQTQSSSRLRGHPRSSTTPGLVDLRSASRVEPLDSCVRSVLITPLPALRDANRVLGPRLFAGLLARRVQAESRIARY
ncbi:MAG: transposase, partial [Deltaproteobacteria bacterium]|nr:transposase [Deltaproteobacteria bacterium]